MEEKKIEDIEKDIQYFDKMVEGAEKLIAPWKIALIVTNFLWAVALCAFICLAYLTPTEIEQTQDFPGQTQEQTVKGAE